ncbi:MAG: hypothetical protein EA399_07635 [Desulfovibrionales bacterium]|nr:MAG: hypothetical protein EA399_07635 [Desulfovibrionales bacterium]
MIYIRLEPEGRTMHFPRLGTVLQLLRKLGLGNNAALIIRDGELLTPDRRLHAGDEVVVRTVTSRG